VGGLALGLAGVFALVPLGIGLPLGRRGRFQASGSRRRVLPRIDGARVAFLLGAPGQWIMGMLTMIAMTALVLAFLAYNRSPERIIGQPVEYQQRASIAYSAAAEGNVYSRGVVTFGDPIYRALVDEVSIHVDYAVDSSLDVSGNGGYRIDALIERSDGWQTTIPLQGSTSFAGASFETLVLLRLDAIESTIADFESEIGVSNQEGESYSLSVVADVSFDGTV
jgi:hypothetical protein